MKMSAIGCPQLVACVVGLSRSNRKDSFEREVGIGKSCLCYKFMYPGVDSYNDDHRSLFALHEFESPILNNNHFLYWGHAVKEFDSRSSEKKTGVLFHVLEQTVIYQDITLRPFNEQVSKPNVPDRYVKRIIGQIESSGKISYKSRDDVALRSQYQQYPSGISRYPRGYLVVIDVSQFGQAFEDQFKRAEIVLDGLLKHNKKFVIVVTKRDNHNPSSLERALSLKRKYHTQVVETSALSNLNICSAFSILAYKVLQKRISGLSDHVPTYEEAAHKNLMAKSSAKQSFLEFLKKRVVHSDERLRAIEDNEETKECVLCAGKLQTERVFAKHVLELHSKKIQLYTGVKENPELQREYLEEFAEQRSDLSIHLNLLRRWIDSYMSDIPDSDVPDVVQCDKNNTITTVPDLPVQEPEPYHTFHPNPDSVQSSPALPKASYAMITGDNEHIEPDNSDGDLSDREYENYDPKNTTVTLSTSEQPLCKGSESTQVPDSLSQQSVPDYDDVDPSAVRANQNSHPEFIGNTATLEHTITGQELSLSKNGDISAASPLHHESIYQNQDPGLVDGQHPTGGDLPIPGGSVFHQQSLSKECETVSTEDTRPEADQDIVQTNTVMNESISQRAAQLQALFSGDMVDSNLTACANEISSPVSSLPNTAASAKKETPPRPPVRQISLPKDDSLHTPESAKQVQVNYPDDVYVNQRVEEQMKGEEERPPLPTSRSPHKLATDLIASFAEKVSSDSTPTEQPSTHHSTVVQPELPNHAEASMIMSSTTQAAVADPKLPPKSEPSSLEKSSTTTVNKPRLTDIKKKVEEKRRKKELESSLQLCASSESSHIPQASSTPEDNSSSTVTNSIRKKPPPLLPKPAVQKQSDTHAVTSPHKVLVDIMDIPPPIPPPPNPEDLDPVSTENVDPLSPPPLPSRTDDMFELLSPIDTKTMENEPKKTPPSPIQNSSRNAPASPNLRKAAPPPPMQDRQPGSPLQSRLRKVLPSTPQGNSTRGPPSPLQTSPKRSALTKKSPTLDKPLQYEGSPKKSPRMSHRETVVLKPSPTHQKPVEKAEIKEMDSRQDKSKRKKYPFVKILEKIGGGSSKQSESNESPEHHSRAVPFIRMDRRPLPPEPFAIVDSDEAAEDEDKHDYEIFGPDLDHRDYVNVEDEIPSRAGIFKWHSFSAADSRNKSSTDDDYPDMRNYKIPIPFQQSSNHARRAPVPQGVWPDYIDGYVNTEINPASSLPIFRQSLPMIPPEPRSGYPDYDYPDMRRIMFRTLPTRAKPTPKGGKKVKKRPPLQNVNWDDTRGRTKSSASDYVPMASITMDDSYINTGHPSWEDTSLHDPPVVQLPPRENKPKVVSRRRYSIDDMTVYMNLPAPPSKVPLPPRTQPRAPNVAFSLQKSLSQETKPKPLPRARGRSSTDVTLHDPSVLMRDPLMESAPQPQPAIQRMPPNRSIIPTNEVLPPRNIRRKTASTGET